MVINWSIEIGRNPCAIEKHGKSRHPVTPAMDVGIAGCDGGQIRAGVVRAAADCFHRATAYRARYRMDRECGGSFRRRGSPDG